LAGDADGPDAFFIRAHPRHPWFYCVCHGRAGGHGELPSVWPEIFEIMDIFSNQTLQPTPGSGLGLPGSLGLPNGLGPAWLS
jgi:hypothetical protein